MSDIPWITIRDREFDGRSGIACRGPRCPVSFASESIEPVPGDQRRRTRPEAQQVHTSADGPGIPWDPGTERESRHGISLAAEYQVSDPERAVNSVVNYETALYQALQLALREIIESMDAEKVLSTRAEINGRLMEVAQPRASHLGIQLTMAAVKDLMLPGKLKEVFAQVVRARHDGLAALERARGESATLRHLANAAKMLEAHPGLLQLRLAQAIGSGSGNSLVLGLPPEAATIPKPPPTE